MTDDDFDIYDELDVYETPDEDVGVEVRLEQLERQVQGLLDRVMENEGAVLDIRLTVRELEEEGDDDV